MENIENNVPAEENGIPAEGAAENPAPVNPAEGKTGPVAAPVTATESDTAFGAAPVEGVPKAPVKEKKTSPFADSPYVVQTPPEKPKAAPKPKKKAGKAWKGILCALLALVVMIGACAVTAGVVGDRYEERLDSLESQFERRLEDLEDQLDAASRGNSASGGNQIVSNTGGMTPAQVYAMNSESVVLIYNVVSSGYYGQGSTSSGSGFILTSDGYVVTNHHVIEGNGTLTVVTSDGTEYPAKLVGSDSANDVALLKMEAQGLQAVTLGDSDELIVGDQVAAIGNPLGELTSTLTVGYISAMERDVNTSGFAINMIQTDAAINSGNSGGPLFNMKGEVIGITTAKYSGSSSSGATIEGIGFAIPINDVRDLLEDLATYGHSTSPYLGVSVSDMDASAAAYYGMPVGAYVGEVVAGSCSEKAGLKVKDIIVELGGYEVETVNDLTRALRKFKAGDTVEMVVYRSGAKLTLTITLDERPENADTQQSQDNPLETIPQEGMPSEGDLEEWFNYLFPYIGGGGE